MARMHSRKRGKSRSRKPGTEKPDWVEYEKEEVEKLIEKLSKNHSSAETGMILRDQYGIPDARAFGLRIGEMIRKKKKLEVPEDLYNLIEKAVNLHGHMNENSSDSNSKHGLMLLESKIRRLGKYYVRKGKLPEDWRYSLEKAKLLVK